MKEHTFFFDLLGPCFQQLGEYEGGRERRGEEGEGGREGEEGREREEGEE